MTRGHMPSDAYQEVGFKRSCKKGWNVYQLTHGKSHLLHFLSVDYKNNITLRGVDIGVFEQKHSVHAIILEYGKLDKKANWPR
jgi:hypothetical protein